MFTVHDVTYSLQHSKLIFGYDYSPPLNVSLHNVKVMLVTRTPNV